MTAPTCTYPNCDFVALVELTWPDARVEALCWMHKPEFRTLPKLTELEQKRRSEALHRILAAEIAAEIVAAHDAIEAES